MVMKLKNGMIDYEAIKFKSGLEIHQQLDTGKLFCACPGYLRSDEPNFSISRRLHAVAGESGIVDSAVAHEALIDKEFVYQGYRDSTCLVEIDEEPPKELNKKALDEALKIALLLNCEIYPVAQIMRKTVIDGSNTSGFQRTVLIGHDGFVETSFGRVRIDCVALEEDSARPIERRDEKVIYRLDRLGIPLVEITSAPDMNRPEQVKEAALKIGEILRACKVKRGIGTIRQDINMSILGMQRIEMKGFQDPAMMISTIDAEIKRQSALNEIYDQVKKVKKSTIKHLDLTKLFSKTNSSLIRSEIEKKGVVLGFKMPGFNGLIGKELTSNKRFGTELAYRARKLGLGGLIHSDEKMDKYQISDDEVVAIRKELSAKKDDAFVLVAFEKNKAEKAIKAIMERAEMQYEFAVAPEVRGALPDGSSEFLRPLPGRARMYPETDLPLLRNKRDYINSLKKELPKLKQEIKEDLKKIGLNPELINLVVDDNFEDFTTLMKVHPKDANLIAKMITLWRNEISTKLSKSADEIKQLITERILEEILEEIIKGKLEDGDVKKVMFDIANGKTFAEAIKIEKMSHDHLEQEITKIVREKPGLSPNAYMGLVIGKLGKDIDKRKTMEILARVANKK